MFLQLRKIVTPLKPMLSTSFNKLYSDLPLKPSPLLKFPFQHSAETLTRPQLKALVLSRFTQGKFFDLLQNVVASPSVLLTASQNLVTPPPSNGLNAPDSLPIVDLVSKCFSVEEMARELYENRFDVGACCVRMVPSDKKGLMLYAKKLGTTDIIFVKWLKEMRIQVFSTRSLQLKEGTLIQRGISLVEDKEIEMEFLKFYKVLYSKEASGGFIPEGIELFPISLMDESGLERPFEEEEEVAAIRGLGRAKALGSDGFSIEFFKIFWKLTNSDFLKILQEFFENGLLNGCGKENFICLI